MKTEIPRIVLPVKAIIRWLIFASIGLVILSSAIRLYGHITGSHVLRKFDLDSENSLPAYFGTILLFSCAAVVAAIGFLKRGAKAPYFKHWLCLSTILALMSVDEMTSIHEPFGGVFRNLMGASGLFYFAWVIPGIAFLALFTMAFWKFLGHLTPRYRKLFVGSGILFVLGAVGFELFGGWHAEKHGTGTLEYVALFTIEESFEMAGVIAMLYSSLTYLAEFQTPVRIVIEADAVQADTAAKSVARAAFSVPPETSRAVQ